jgi:hypothetical protein
MCVVGSRVAVSGRAAALLSGDVAAGTGSGAGRGSDATWPSWMSGTTSTWACSPRATLQTNGAK